VGNTKRQMMMMMMMKKKKKNLRSMNRRWNYRKS
jgi:hypothetical protein